MARAKGTKDLTSLHPQTTAEAIGKYGCLAMCYVFCVIEKAREAKNGENYFLSIVCEAMEKGIIDKECTVYDADKFLEFVAKYLFLDARWTVQKKNITAIDGIVDATPVRFYAQGHGGHWVVVKNGKIVFNPLVKSFNVENGKPIEARVLVQKK